MNSQFPARVLLSSILLPATSLHGNPRYVLEAEEALLPQKILIAEQRLR